MQSQMVGQVVWLEGLGAHRTPVEFFSGIVVEYYSMRHQSSFEIELLVADIAAVDLVRLLSCLLLEHDALFDIPLDDVLSLKSVQRCFKWVVFEHVF